MKMLKELRKKAGYTQTELGKLVGVSKSTMSMYESGIHEPDLETLKRFANILGVSVDVLIGTEQNRTEEDETWLIRENLRRSPEYRILFDAANNAKPEHLRAAVAVLQSLKGDSNA